MTWPRLSTPKQSFLVGQLSDVRALPGRNTPLVSFQAEVPPVGLVEWMIAPSLPAATHSALDEQETAWIWVDGSTWSATVQAEAPLVGCVVVIRLPAASPATHSVVLMQFSAVRSCVEAYGALAILAGAEKVSASAASGTTADVKHASPMAAATAQRTAWTYFTSRSLSSN